VYISEVIRYLSDNLIILHLVSGLHHSLQELFSCLWYLLVDSASHVLAQEVIKQLYTMRLHRPGLLTKTSTRCEGVAFARGWSNMRVV